MLKAIAILVYTILLVCGQGESFLASWTNRRSSLLSSHSSSSSSLLQCPEIPPDMTPCSMAMSHSTIDGASVQEANVWVALLTSKCHPQVMKFVCSVRNPVCLQSHQVMPIGPCREFCNQVQATCNPRMTLFGFKWPAHVDCSQFPTEEDGMCIQANRETITCPPCQQTLTQTQVVRKYCQADLVIKAPVVRVSASGNTSNLVVTLGRGVEHILPQSQAQMLGPLISLDDVPSPGFLDTNDERYHMVPVQSTRLLRQGQFDIVKQSSTASPIKSSTFPFSTVSPKGLLKDSFGDSPQGDAVPKNSYPGTPSRQQRERKHRMSRDDRRRRRERRSSRTSEHVGLRSMLLDCAGCSALELTASDRAARSNNRWLIMGKRISSKIQNDRALRPSTQITLVIPWSKQSTSVRQALWEIRSIPREILCDPNAQVQMNFEGSLRRRTYGTPRTQSRPPAGSLLTHYLQSQSVAFREANRGTSKSPQSSPWFEGSSARQFPYDSFLQNDAGLVSNASQPVRSSTKLERRRQRQLFREANQIEPAHRSGQQVKQDETRPRDTAERRHRREQRRQRDLQVTANMTPDQKKQWKQRKRRRRERRRRMRQQEMLLRTQAIKSRPREQRDYRNALHLQPGKN